MKRLFFIVIGIVFLTGCASTQKQSTASAPVETRAEETQAMKSVVGAVSGKQVSDEDLKKLSKDIRKDKEAQSAMEAIAGPMTEGVHIKYCPVDGKRFSPKFEICPEHGVALKDVE